MPEPTQSNYEERLRADFPDLTVDKVTVLGMGWEHVALEVNDTFIFRIPRGVYRTDDLSKTVAYETEILRHLQNKLPVSIPDPQYIAPNQAYFGYPKLTGEKLIDLWPSLTEAEKTVLWDDWVAIAIATHQNVPPDMARTLGVPDFDMHLDIAQEILDFEEVDSEVLDFAKRTIVAMESADIRHQQLMVIHNDLQFHNLLADPQTKRVTAVIDWTSVCIGTIEREFSMWEWSHDDQMMEVAQRYLEKTGIKVNLSQAKLYRHIEEVCDYVEQIKSGDTEGAEESLDHINRWIAETVYNSSDIYYHCGYGEATPVPLAYAGCAIVESYD